MIKKDNKNINNQDNQVQQVEMIHTMTKEKLPTWSKWLIGISVPLLMAGGYLYHSGEQSGEILEHLDNIDFKMEKLEIGQSEIKADLNRIDKDVTINGFRIGELENKVNKLTTEVEGLDNKVDGLNGFNGNGH